MLIPEPHILGFLSPPKRLVRVLNRRKLADDIQWRQGGGSRRAGHVALPTRPPACRLPESGLGNLRKVLDGRHGHVVDEGHLPHGIDATSATMPPVQERAGGGAARCGTRRRRENLGPGDSSKNVCVVEVSYMEMGSYY